MTEKQKNETGALDVALYFIGKSSSEKKPITNKKLQKLVYYAQAWSLVINKEKLFDEKIEAWVHGPAIPSLYKKFKIFGAEPITLEDVKVKFDFTKKQKNILDSVWKVYGKYDANYLEVLTHSELPWLEAREGIESSDGSSNEISEKTILKYYSEKLESAQK